MGEFDKVQRSEKSERRCVRIFGGDKRDRTADLLNAIQALSQLSYTPIGDSVLFAVFSCGTNVSIPKGRAFVNDFFKIF